MKSFKHVNLFYLHFLKSLKRDNVLSLCLYGQRSSHTEFQLMFLNLRYRPHYYKYKDLYYTPQNYSTVTT